MASALERGADSERLGDLMGRWRRGDGESSRRPEGRSAAARRPRACPTESGRKDRLWAGLDFPQDIGGEKISGGDERRAGLWGPGVEGRLPHESRGLCLCSVSFDAARGAARFLAPYP